MAVGRFCPLIFFGHHISDNSIINFIQQVVCHEITHFVVPMPTKLFTHSVILGIAFITLC